MQTMFDVARLKKAEKLFAELLALPAPQRESELALRCGQDAGLGDFVRRLLLHDDSGMGGFLRAPAGAFGEAAPNWQPLPENALLGNFQLLRRIGEGGMGIVYEARQAHPERIVALKVVRGGRFVDRHSFKLFEREVQALARLRHPCIASIYEAGGADDERQFFAMEYVEGRPLMEYVREQAPERRRRLELFRRICDAIHYAHQRGVMHRDLKPSNILVDGDGNPRILDFGLARITDAEMGMDVSRTAVGRIQGTLAYMSPEQARGDSNEIDTRSDVYSLGVILYELMTEKLPYDVAGLPLTKAVEIICTQPPARSLQLKGDIETITLKALEKEPQARYAGAAVLSEDIQRFLTNRPIEAKRHSSWYVLRKALARHRLAASFTAAFIAVICVSAVALAFMYRQQFRAREAEAVQRRLAEIEADRANQETRKAVEERNKTEKFAEFMEETLKGVGPAVSLGRDNKMLKELMDAAAKRIEEGALIAAPEAELRLRNTIGKVYIDIAEFEAAHRMLDPSLEFAKRTQGHQSAEYATALETHATLLRVEGRYGEALAEFEEALAICRRLFSGDHRRLVSGLNDTCVVLMFLGRLEEALPRCEEALAMSQRLFVGDHMDVRVSLNSLGQCLQSLGRHVEALPKLEAAADMAQRLQPGDSPDVATGLNELSRCLVSLGRYAEALPKSKSALEMWQRLHEGDHPNVAVGLTNFGQCLQFLGKLDEALPQFEAALEIYRRLFSDDHPHVALGLSNVGQCLQHLGRHSEALPKLEEALAMSRRLFPADHPYVAAGLTLVARCLNTLGRPEEALAKYEEALAMFQRMYKSDHPDLAIGMDSVALCLDSLGRHEEALPKFEGALEIWRRSFPGDHAHVALGLNHVGQCLRDLGRSQEAAEKLEESLAMYQRLYPGDHPTVARALINAAAGQQSSRRLAEALDRCKEALSMLQKVRPPTHPDVRAAQIRLGSILIDLNRLDEAEDVLVSTWKDIADRTNVPRKSKQECLEALVKVCDARNAAEPGDAPIAKAEEYRALLKTLSP